MAEYIEKDAILRHLADVQFGEKTAQLWDGVEDAIQAVIHFPAADVVPVRHGRWVVQYDIWGKNVKTVEGYKCSKCGGFSFYQDNYCADCGARMDEVDNGV